MVETQVILVALGIFALRLIGVAISTIRMLLLVQGRRIWCSVLGFLESLVFAVALGSVVTQLGNTWNLMAYCAGFAVGTYLGMVLESRFITNFVTVTVVSADKAHEVADEIRAAGFGATELLGRGAEGFVGSVRVVIRRRDARQVLATVNKIDADAFVTMDETRAVRHGYMPARPTR